MNHLQGLNVLILGLGESGLAMARWCARFGAAVHVADTREAPPQAARLAADVPAATLHHGLAPGLLDGVNLLLKSPGLAPGDAQVAPLLARADELGIPVRGELALFASALADLKAERGYAPQVVAITGTNGKTTTTSLAALLIERAGRRVGLAGNIGPTLLDTLAAALDLEPAPQAEEAAQVEAELEAGTPAGAAAELPDVLPAAEQGSDGEGQPGDSIAAESDAADTLTPGEDPIGPPSHDAAASVPLVATGPDEAGVLPESVLEADAQAHAEADAQAAAGLEDRPLPIAPPPPAAPVFEHLPEVWVLELSSFQLDGVTNFEPSSATVLNLTQDHLDWHGTMPAYGAAKARIFGKQAVMVINRDDPAVEALIPPPEVIKAAVKGRPSKTVHRKVVRFGLDAPGHPGDFGLVNEGGIAWLVRALESDETIKRRKDEVEEIVLQRLMPADALRIRGRHNASNALAALALATAIGCPLAPMLHGLREYGGEPHRVEEIGIVGGVHFFDDSKGTNVGATVAAFKGLGEDIAPAKLVAILGGDGKGQDFAPLAGPLARHARAVALIGRDAAAIEAAVQEQAAAAGIVLQRHATLPEATRWAFTQAHQGDAVLLSPACASLDMFRNYAHRAEVFVETVQAIAADRGELIG
jgi:UDP-N-acetylmuramoylalanine--D-glutamate ligase